ncbi:MAG: hypothetical protein ACR2FH_02580 [Caulobacteraceae bacterium]
MTHPRFAALAAALLLSPAALSARAAEETPAAAAPVPASQPAPLRAAQNDRDPYRIICKREEVIGTRLGGHKTCHTFADWENIARDAARATSDLQTNSDHFNTGGR